MRGRGADAPSSTRGSQTAGRTPPLRPPRWSSTRRRRRRPRPPSCARASGRAGARSTGRPTTRWPGAGRRRARWAPARAGPRAGGPGSRFGTPVARGEGCERARCQSTSRCVRVGRRPTQPPRRRHTRASQTKATHKGRLVVRVGAAAEAVVARAEVALWVPLWQGDDRGRVDLAEPRALCPAAKERGAAFEGGQQEAGPGAARDGTGRHRWGETRTCVLSSGLSARAARAFCVRHWMGRDNSRPRTMRVDGSRTGRGQGRRHEGQGRRVLGSAQGSRRASWPSSREGLVGWAEAREPAGRRGRKDDGRARTDSGGGGARTGQRRRPGAARRPGQRRRTSLSSSLSSSLVDVDEEGRRMLSTGQTERPGERVCSWPTAPPTATTTRTRPPTTPTTLWSPSVLLQP